MAGNAIVDVNTFHKDNLLWFNRYKRYMTKKGLGKNTIYNYSHDLIQWMAYIRDYQCNVSILKVSVEDLEEFINYCRDERCNNDARTSRRIASLNQFYEFVVGSQIKPIKNPVSELKRPNVHAPVIKNTVLNEEQIMDMKVKLSDNGDIQLELFALVSLYTMARITAIANIKWEQLDLEQHAFINVQDQEKQVVLLFNEEIKEKLILWKEHCRKRNIVCDYVFVAKAPSGFWRQVSATVINTWSTTIGNMIGVENFYAHNFRATGMACLRERGMSNEDIGALLNGENINIQEMAQIKSQYEY